MKEYQINVIAGTKVMADMVEAVKDATYDATTDIKPVPPGPLPDLTVGGVEKKMDVGSGIWTWKGIVLKNPSGTDGVPDDYIGVLWFDKQNWSIIRIQPLPVKEGVEKIDPEGSEVPQERAVANYVKPIKDQFESNFTDVLITNYNGLQALAYEIGEFSGWQAVFEVIKNFRKIKIYHKARNTNVTILKYRICENSVNGNVLAEGQIPVNVPNGSAAILTIDLGKLIVNSNNSKISLEWWANGNMSLPRSHKAFPVATKIRYKSGALLDTNFAQSSAETSTNETYYPYVEFIGEKENLIISQETSNDALEKGTAVGSISNAETKAVSGRAVFPIKKGLEDITKDTFVESSIEIRGALNIYFNSSSFCSWAQLIGIVPDLAQISFIVRPFSSANLPTYARLILRDGDPLGDILFDKTFFGIFPVNVNTKVMIPVPGLDTSKSLFSAVITDGNIALIGDTIDTDLDTAHIVRYSTSKGNITVNTLSSDKKKVMFFELGKGTFKKSISDEVVEDIKESLSIGFPEPVILLTQKAYIYKGYQYNIFNRNAVVTSYGDSHENYVIDFDGPAAGSQLNRGLRTYGGTTNNMNYNITLSVSKGRNIIATAQQNILSVDLSNGADVTLDVLAVGDSLLAGGDVVRSLKTIFDNDVMNINFKGTLGDPGAKHEGRGGWTINDYYGAGRTLYRINVDLIEANPSLGAQYGQGTAIFKVEEVYITDGIGYFSVSIVSGSSPITTGGTLALFSGSGPASITYSSSAPTSGNPFYNPVSGKFDFAYYLTKTGQTILPKSFIPLQLGVNDMFGSTDLMSAQNKANTMANQLNEMIDSIHAYDSSLKVIVPVTVFPSSQDGFGYNYGQGQTREMYVKTGLFTWQKKVLDTFDSDTRRTQNTFVIPLHLNIDTEYNYPYSMQKPNSRYSGTERIKVQTNGVHPNSDGYAQIADMYAGIIKYFG